MFPYCNDIVLSFGPREYSSMYYLNSISMEMMNLPLSLNQLNRQNLAKNLRMIPVQQQMKQRS